ncbi:MAG TPA: 4'-phosphopantetheinyl transferase superfamily protein [Ktedonobacteraceae bacterium]|nr:4'-phosphopantetheinyl transferase superfamily protein [Ktedonobacteraceae bacterium]
MSDRVFSADSEYNEQRWATSPADLTLSENQVHVWRNFLHASQEVRDRMLSVLSEEERIRAGRFYFERDRQRWIMAHGVLRILLARYLHLEPEKLLFVSNEYGKPALAPLYESRLEFNLSHSRDIALYALTNDRQVGVDIEYMKDGIEYDELARVSFSPNERAVLRSLPQEAKHEAFFNCWTRKEAYIKARGMGLSLPLDLFDVSLLSGKPAALLASREDPREAQRWTFQHLFPGPGYAGALAVEGSGWQLHCWQWV